MNTLIYQAGALGDSIAMLPLISAWRGRYPQSELTLMGRLDFGQLLRSRGLVDRVLDCQSATLAPFFIGHFPDRLGPLLTTIDIAFVCAADDSPVMAALQEAGITRLPSQPPFPTTPLHIVDYHLQLLQGFDALHLQPVPRLPLVEQHAGSDSCTVTKARRRVVVHSGSGSRRKNWPHKRFVALSQKLVEAGFAVDWLMGPAEQRQSVPPGVHSLHDLPLETVATRLQHSCLYLGNDSGVSHLAAAVGTPSVVLFGPSDPKVWAPRGSNVRLIRANPPCAPCHPANGDACESGCMDTISIDQVWRVCTEMVS